MAGFNQGEVLDSGRAPSSRQRATGLIVTAVIAGGIALAAIAAGLTWWTSRPPTSDALEITAITVVGPTAVTVVAAPPIGGLATPAGAALPARRPAHATLQRCYRNTTCEQGDDGSDVQRSAKKAFDIVQQHAARTPRMKDKRQAIHRARAACQAS